MANDNPKGDQAKKQPPTPAKQNTGGNRPTTPGAPSTPKQQPGQAGKPARPANDAAPRPENGPARQPRQPASAKPISLAKPGGAPAQPNGGRLGAAPRSGAGAPQRNQESEQNGNGGEVYSQRVFEPDISDTVPARDRRPMSGPRRDFDRGPAPAGGSRPARGPAPERSPAPERRAAPTEPPRRPTAPATPPAKTPAPARTGQPSRPQQGTRPSASPVTSQRAPVTAARPAAAPVPVTEIIIPANITVRELAEKMRHSPIEVIKTLMNYGMMIPITDSIDFDTAQLIGEELGVTVLPEKQPEPEVEEVAEEAPKTLRQRIMADEKEENLVIRPPIVTVLGHVDHGKTTLLDAIRETRVVDGEAGGITQHIGAYQVEKNERLITFLDTPGHEAFTAMRARGAQVTDIAVLVVAADDGVMPQTKEAIAHVKAAQVPIIVALNKVDKPQSNPDRVKQELADNGVLVEEYGGDTMCVPVSAKFRRGIGDLLESILLVADIEPQKANPTGDCVGTVIEGRLDKNRGATATLLVQNGTLRVSDSIVTGETYAKIRAMYNDKGDPITEAPPAAPVQILGLADVPVAGDTFKVVPDERTARAIVSERQDAKRAAAAPVPARTLESIFAQAEAGQVKELNLILKADVQGSIEPIVNSLTRLGDEKLKVKLLHAAPGNITEGDVMLAVASGAIILGFSVVVDSAAQRMAETEGVDIRIYNIIYKLIEDVQKALTGLLEPVYKEVITGHAEIRAVFKITKVGKIAGSYVTDGELTRGSQVRLKRGGQVLTEDKIATLKRFQEDATEVKTGFECGINLHNFNDFEVGDILETYKKERVR